METYFDGTNDDYLLENNLIGAKTHEELIEAETFAFSIRASQIEAEEYKILNFEESDFIRLHEFLFKDVYRFAGTYRDVAIAKGDTVFCYPQFINDHSKALFSELNLCDFENDTLMVASEKLAYFKTELNLLHPFREGNGRTIRIFLSAFAKSKGFEWQYEKLDRESYMNAMIQSVLNHKQLTLLIQKTLINLPK